MNQPILSKADINNLYQILEQANKAYLKQSRLTDKPAFNILRVLAAFRLLFHESPPAIYNAILFITKNYDPQTYYHWKKAIEELNRNRNTLFKSKSNYCRPQIATYTKTYQNSFNRSRINENQHLQSKSYAQINIPKEMNNSKEESFEDEDQKDVSQTNAETGKRMFYTKADSISHVSKNHYISFEPYRHSLDHYHNQYFDKENINSTNVEESRKKESAYQYIEAIQRDLNRTTKNSQIKTPIDQSFIKNINSSESPYLYTKMPQEVIDPIEQQMNARAKTFYCFNLKLKVFSSLQANSYVFIKAKENEMKAKLQYHSKLLQTSFINLNQYVKIQNEIRLKQQKADLFHQSQLSSKVFSILKLVFELRKNNDAEKSPSIDKFNKINYEFILSLLFALNRSTQNQKMSFIDFDNKIIDLIHSDQTNKLFLIVKYFGKHSWTTQENIQNLISLYKKRICKQAFIILRSQRQRNLKFQQIRQRNLKKQSFFSLKIRWNQFACYKQKIKSAEAKKNKRLLQKVMKSLLQIVYSTKLYSKRWEYIQRKHLFHLKAKAYSCWIERAKIASNKRIEATKQISKIVEKIQLLIKKISLKKIKDKIREVQEKILRVANNNVLIKKMGVFSKLKMNLMNGQLLRQSQKQMQKLKCAMALSRWKENTNKGKAISCIIDTMKAYYFRKLVLSNFEESIEIMKDIQYSQIDLQRKVFKAMRRFIIEQNKRRQSQMQNLKNKLCFMSKSIAISLVKRDFYLQKAKREKENMLQKTQKVKNHIKFHQFQTFFSKFSQLYYQRTKKKNLQICLSNALYTSALKNYFKQLRQMNFILTNSKKVNEMIYQNKAQRTAKKILDTICLSKVQKIKQIRKKNCSHYFAITLQSIYQSSTKKSQLARFFSNSMLYNRVFKGLAMLLQKSKQVTQISKQFYSRKNWDIIKDSLSHCRKAYQVKKLYQKDQFSSAFKRLRKQKFLKSNFNELQEWKIIKLKKDMIKKLILSKKIKQKDEQITSKTNQFKKWLGITRISNFYITKLISNKHLYMALKFRALKLCMNSFTALASKRPQRKQISMLRKGLAQRLSTDIAE